MTEICTRIHSGNGTLWRVGFAWTYRRLPQLFIVHRTVPLQDWLRRDGALKAQSAHSRDPSRTSAPLILNPPTTEHPAPSSVRGPPALTQTQQEMSQRRSPGPHAVTYQQDGTSPAEAPHHSLPHRHTAGSGGGPAVAARRPPGSPRLPGAALPWERRGRSSHTAGTHTSKRGRRRGSDISRQRRPLRRQRPGGEPRQSPAKTPGATRLRRRREPRGASPLPPGRPTSPLPRGGAGAGERIGGEEEAGRQVRPRRPGAALHSAGYPGDVAVRADALITRRQRRRPPAAAAGPGRAGGAGRGGDRAAPPSWWWQPGLLRRLPRLLVWSGIRLK